MQVFEVRIKYYSGFVLEDFNTVQEAAAAIKELEDDDKRYGDFEEDYYEIRDTAADQIVDYYYTREGVLVDNGFK